MSRAHAIRAVILAAAVLLPTLTLAQDFKAQAEASAARWDQTFNKGDAAGVAKLYGQNARLLPAGAPAVTGETNIQQFWGGLIQKGFGQHKISVQGAEAKGDLAYVYGRWQATGPGEGGAAKQYEGNWLNVMERQGGEWRTVLHGWN